MIMDGTWLAFAIAIVMMFAVLGLMFVLSLNNQPAITIDVQRNSTGTQTHNIELQERLVIKG